eukprot:SAG31_NODE_117_length_24022_cov_6.878067_20_plen_141_part_00
MQPELHRLFESFSKANKTIDGDHGTMDLEEWLLFLDVLGVLADGDHAGIFCDHVGQILGRDRAIQLRKRCLVSARSMAHLSTSFSSFALLLGISINRMVLRMICCSVTNRRARLIFDQVNLDDLIYQVRICTQGTFPSRR